MFSIGRKGREVTSNTEKGNEGGKQERGEKVDYLEIEPKMALLSEAL